MKKGFKFPFVVRAFVNGRTKYFHYVSRERSLQKYFYYKNSCLDCTAAELVDVLSGRLLRSFGIW